MKKTINSIVVLSTLFLFSSFTGIETHIGEWKGKDSKGTQGVMILEKSNHAIFKVRDRILGGENFEINGTRAECKYEIDYTKNPIWLDIIILDKSKKIELGRLKGIVKFISDTKMLYRTDFEGGRYTEFDASDKNDTMLFEKVEK